VALLVTETLNGGVKLSKEDLEVAVKLWEDTINPACIEFQKRTGKPAEAMREAIAGVIARRVNHNSRWNTWQKVWWKKKGKGLTDGHNDALGSKFELPPIIAHLINYIWRGTQ
jgi:hypothetical protein